MGVKEVITIHSVMCMGRNKGILKRHLCLSDYIILWKQWMPRKWEFTQESYT